MRTFLNFLLVAVATTLCVGCGENEVEPTLVGCWQLEGFGVDDVFIPIADNRKECYSFVVGTESSEGAYRCGEGKASANQIRLFFYIDSLRIGSTKIYEDIEDAIIFMDLYDQMNRYEFSQNKLKLYSADSTKKYLMYHRISN